MDQIQILQIAASLVGGGAVGAIITALVAAHKARILPIGQRIEVAPLFTPDFGGKNFSTSVTVSDGASHHNFPNLHLAEIEVVNRGNKDLATFGFGITLSARDKAVHVEPRANDRHHVAELRGVCTPTLPSSMLDFELRPFNRGDTYTFRIFIVAAKENPDPIKMSSSEAVRFTEIPTMAETLAVAASTLAVKLGPLEIRLPR